MVEERHRPLWTELPMVAGAAFVLVLTIRQFAARIPYPFDLEWMEGGMLLHAMRAMQWEQIYVEPGPEFIPFIYPPLYAWVVGLLGHVFELGYPLGRVVSALGTLAAAAALVFATRVERLGPLLGLGAAGMFLTTYDEVGAFFDLVRTDGLMIGLLAWALVAARAQWWRTAGILLTLAFATKHNTAAFGLPILLWAWRFHGRDDALRFALWSVVPALSYVVVMQITSGGLFLTYLLGVPSAHPYVGSRGYPSAQLELIEALPVAAFLGLLGTCTFAARGELKRTGRLLAILVAWGLVAWGLVEVVHQVGLVETWKGAVAEHFGKRSSQARYLRKMLEPTSLGFIACSPVLIGLVGYAIKKGAWTESAVFWVPNVALGVLLVAIMRAHHGGYINVLIPGMWLVAMGGVLAGAHAVRAVGYPAANLAMALLVAGQCWYGSWDAERYNPTQADVDAGRAIIEQLREREGTVFSPQHPYYPVMAGKNPTFAQIALWDIDHRGGPLREYVSEIEATIEQRRWDAILVAQKDLKMGVEEHYELDRSFRGARGQAMRPKTGWSVQPKRLYVRPDTDD